ncbi:MAG: hypothetical protein RSH25_15870 [Bacteroides sp.]|uniref:hypothetical protein n=1 Tax=Bacteroides sp. TaxID=29523 RepID=UPI002FC85037
MATTEIILALIALVSGPVGGWLTARLLRKKYDAEVAKLQAEVKGAQINSRGDELENVKTAMDILMQQVVEPLKIEINAIRKELVRLRKVVEKANNCPHSANCPVRDELQKSERIDLDPPQRQSGSRKKIRAEPGTCTHERGEDGYTDERYYTVADRDRL